MGDQKYIYIISLGTITPNYNGAFTSTIYMTNYNNDISDWRENISERRDNKSTIIITIIIIQIISSEVTFTTALPLNKEGILMTRSSPQLDTISGHRHHHYIIVIAG